MFMYKSYCSPLAGVQDYVSGMVLRVELKDLLDLRVVADFAAADSADGGVGVARPVELFKEGVVGEALC